MDLTFFAYLKSVMQRTTQASDAEVQAAVQRHARLLADPDPARAMQYRTAMHAESGREWPSEASHDLLLELEKPWAPSEAGLAYWRNLPAGVRDSYTGQGALVIQATLKGLSTER
jgi:hypothetical protein